MRRSDRAFVTLCCLVGVLLPGTVSAQVYDVVERARLRAEGVDARVLDQLERRPRTRVIALLERPSDDSAVIARLPKGEGRVLQRYAGLRSLALEVSPAALARIVEAPGVRSVGPDVELELQLAESVPLVGMDSLQSHGYDGAGVTVAIIDTGIDTDHPGLSHAVAEERCYCTDDCCPNGTSFQSGPGRRRRPAERPR